MRTLAPLRFLTLFCAGVLLVAAVGTVIAAQDATPAPHAITDSLLGRGLPNDAPGKVLQLERVTLAPGAVIPPHVHPGAYVIVVEAGEFGFTVNQGEAELTRAGTTSPEPIAAGSEVVAHEGDAIFENGGVVHTARNAGTTPTVVLAAALLAAGQPSLQPTNNEGTPISS